MLVFLGQGPQSSLAPGGVDEQGKEEFLDDDMQPCEEDVCLGVNDLRLDNEDKENQRSNVFDVSLGGET